MIKTYTPLLNHRKLIIFIGIVLTSFSAKGQWTPLNVNMTSNFTDVQFLNDSVGFVTGSYGAILKTTDGGLNWVNTNNTGSMYSFKIHFPGENIGYALGGNYLFKTIDQGATWSALPTIQTSDKSNLFF